MLKNNESDTNKTYPKGHFTGMWMGIGIAIFSGIGVPISFITGNPGLMGIGPAIGIAIGISIGQGIERKYEKEGRIRPLNNEEIARKKRMLIIASALLVLGIIAFIAFLAIK